MHIEEITPKTLEHADDRELKSLRFRFIQLWENLYAKGKTITDMDADEFLGRYRLLRREMKGREIEIVTVTAVDRALLKSNIGFMGLIKSGSGDLVIVENYVSMGGSYVRDPKSAGDVDVIIRARESARDEGMELKLGRLLGKQTSKECHFVYAPTGPHSSYIPVGDLVLRMKPRPEVVRVDETRVEKSARAYYEGLEQEDGELKDGNEAAAAALAPGSVLDVGCGSGLFLKRLRDKGRHVYGVDANDTAVRMCREKGVPSHKMDVAGGLSWDLDEGNRWDNIVFIHSLEHMPDPALLAGQAGKLARKRVIVVAPLGERADPGHKQTWAKLDDFKAVFGGGGWEVKPIAGTGCAIAVLDKESLEKAAVRPFGKFDPPKPRMSGSTDAFSIEEIWDWAKDRLPLDVEEKLNGFRFILQKLGDRVGLTTEGGKDRTKQLPAIAEALAGIPDDFILDASVGIERRGRALPRVRVMTIMADKPELEAGDTVKATLFDIPFWKEDLHEKPLSERRKLLEEFQGKFLKANKSFGLTSFNVVRSREEIESKFRSLGRLPQSEGLMLKTLGGAWDPSGSTTEWAKLKIEVELKVIAIERHAVKGGGFNYTCGLLPGDSAYTNLTEFCGEKYIDLGRCFNTKVKAEPGDILTVRVEEIIPQETELRWLGANVVDVDGDRTKPYFAAQAEDMARRANVLQKDALLGPLSPEEADRFIDLLVDQSIIKDYSLPGIYLVAPHGRFIREGRKKVIVKIKPLPEAYVGRDVALVEDNVVHGIIKLRKPEEIDRAGFKALAAEHAISAEEAKRWGFSLKSKLYAYRFDAVEIFPKPLGYDPPPGVQTVIREVDLGALSKQGQETGNLTFKAGDEGTGVCQIHLMGLTQEEADRLKAEQSRLLVARLDPGRLEAALKSAIGEQGAHLDIRLRRGEEKVWQGGEIFIGNVSGLSKIKDLVAGKRKLRAPWKQSRTDEPRVEAVLGPLGWLSAGERKVDLFEPGSAGATADKWGAMIRIDAFKWELYLADEHAKKLRITGARILDGNWLFAYVPVNPKERIWMLSRLADDDHEKVQKSITEEELTEMFKAGEAVFKFMKVDKKQQIVGGIIYEPNIEDTQGDFMKAPEIEQAMYRFMMKYSKSPKRIKLIHQGQPYYFPILECFQADEDTKKGGGVIKAGAWWLMIKVENDDIWKKIENEELNAFSMGGSSQGVERKNLSA